MICRYLDIFFKFFKCNSFYCVVMIMMFLDNCEMGFWIIFFYSKVLKFENDLNISIDVSLLLKLCYCYYDMFFK